MRPRKRTRIAATWMRKGQFPWVEGEIHWAQESQPRPYNQAKIPWRANLRLHGREKSRNGATEN